MPSPHRVWAVTNPRGENVDACTWTTSNVLSATAAGPARLGIIDPCRVPAVSPMRTTVPTTVGETRGRAPSGSDHRHVMTSGGLAQGQVMDVQLYSAEAGKIAVANVGDLHRPSPFGGTRRARAWRGIMGPCRVTHSFRFMLIPTTKPCSRRARWLAPQMRDTALCSSRPHPAAPGWLPATASSDLAERRLRELRCSAAAIGCAEVHLLGYDDSGMDGRAGRPDHAFSHVDVETAAARLARLLESVGADVLTVYDPAGGYGHPDHIQVNQVGVRAAQLAGTRVVLEATVDRRPLLRVTALAEVAAPGPAGVAPGSVLRGLCPTSSVDPQGRRPPIRGQEESGDGRARLASDRRRRRPDPCAVPSTATIPLSVGVWLRMVRRTGATTVRQAARRHLHHPPGLSCRPQVVLIAGS